MTIILDGKKLSGKIASNLEGKISKLRKKPKLVIVQVGSTEESNRYIRRKIIFGERIGAEVAHRKYPTGITEKKLISEIGLLNSDRKIHGIIVQLPLPSHLDQGRIIGALDPVKDVDGFHGLFTPATAKGVIVMLDNYKVEIAGKKAVVVGKSELVGKPIALALLRSGATVTVCHKQTKNLKRETIQADILVVAAGHPKLITKSHVKKGAVVIDVGINVLKNGKLSGDVDFKKVSKIVRAISPVPGGIGPMTVASLFENLLEAYCLQT
ncbi:MAG: hypothetical protein A3F53_02720 [Candidatus Zambryskibacteria bacterium RIFCSPHIGHO2_12_FULL_48_10]|uniref:Bifunctional protein FolD n=1 Tax=Candidatus Zambryskibacteria bacterium RIFCSPHIGHO2_01_FULL_46_25 TaxID=1802738 RepID=A0A1G2SYB9_9BACT|nr:MAG: Bifunctional protein FolD [Parcubacteria group bacterium GW2011_GWA1_47_10]OHA90030.1 MAG: hypothetical protein A2838_00115 [Candidatus Zambryskibacteria bacterium RIFCSPHIGHO2_01_FULL_46_25]OHB01223.1 MAG: hypothetical protein A3F53_02720 [Candidatus Zambryskibacteria bacterium RIFCSPHIGHO2_12_FULL_48_10]OHB06596.1 MAG: hypothetical protein A3A31_03145 [Candidatus Zambryskibacteria bacterium RIFCSPLOWO2_01_FULL_48_25]